MFCSSTSRCRGLVCVVRLWHFLIILTCFYYLTSDLRLYDGSDLNTYLKMRGLGPGAIFLVRPTGFNCWLSFFFTVFSYMYYYLYLCFI